MWSARSAALALSCVALVSAACGPQSSESTADDATPNVVDVAIDYQPGSTCYSNGYPTFRLGIDPVREVAWLDFDADNETDIIRETDFIYFRATSFPGFEDHDGWIRVPADPADPMNQVARLSSLGDLSYTLLIPDAPTVPLFEEFEALRSSGTNGEALLDENVPESPVVRWVEDPDGNIAKITVEPQDPGPLGEQLITITPAPPDEHNEAAPPPASETVDLDEVSASAALLSSGLFDPACRDPEAPDDVEADRQCVLDAVAEMTVREWIDVHATGAGPGISAPCQ